MSSDRGSEQALAWPSMGSPDTTESRGPFPFIVGCQRSGTTLLQAMLDGHPQLAMAPESHFIVPLSRRFGDGWSPSGETYAAFADALLERRRFAFWEMSRAELLEALESAGPTDFAEAVRTVFATWAKRRGKPGYGDKTPRHASHLVRLGALFPEARFIHLIRDGRDVSLSMAAAFERGPQSPVEGAMFWRTAVEAAQRGGAELGSGRYLEVRYERLVAEPGAVIAELCAFLGLDPDERMLRPADNAERIAASYPETADHRNLGRPIEARRSWREEMPPEGVENFELLAGDLLERLGYETAGAAPRGEALAARRNEVLAAELISLRRSVFAAERRAAEMAGRAGRAGRAGGAAP